MRQTAKISTVPAALPLRYRLVAQLLHPADIDVILQDKLFKKNLRQL